MKKKPKKFKAKGPKKPCTAGRAAREERYELFCLEYIKDMNGARSARAVGYAEGSAHVECVRLLANPSIKARIKVLLDERNARTLLDGDQILLETKKLADSDIRRLFHQKTGTLLPMDEWPDDVAKAVSSVKVKELYNRHGVLLGYIKEVKLWDKPKPLELLGKNKKLWTDVVESTQTHSLGAVDPAEIKKIMKELEEEV